MRMLLNTYLIYFWHAYRYLKYLNRLLVVGTLFFKFLFEFTFFRFTHSSTAGWRLQTGIIYVKYLPAQNCSVYLFFVFVFIQLLISIDVLMLRLFNHILTMSVSISLWNPINIVIVIPSENQLYNNSWLFSRII